MTLQLQRKPTNNPANHQDSGFPSPSPAYKAWFDPALLIAAHLILAPVWLLLWTLIPLMIWLGDRGPIFYRQRRAGKDGREFTLLKFRTMVPNADHAGPAWTTEGDERMTKVGRLLRRTALDELPGVISIWKRDMSFVGPRALEVNEQRLLEDQIPGFEARLQVLPGLSGLAQVCDKQDSAEEKLAYDLEYIRRLSPALDLKLLVLSVLNTVSARWDMRAGKSAHLAVTDDSGTGETTTSDRSKTANPNPEGNREP